MNLNQIMSKTVQKYTQNKQFVPNSQCYSNLSKMVWVYRSTFQGVWNIHDILK
jgi:hypothetical protein